MAAALYVQGFTKSDCVRRTFKMVQPKPEAVWQKAAKTFAKPQVMERVAELLEGMKIEQIHDARRALLETLEHREEARQAQSWTAVAKYDDMLLKYHGLLKNQVFVTEEQRLDDAELLEQLSSGDPAKHAALKAVLGSTDGFDTRH